ncbi:hypothetical protein PCASD_23773, partial [Puccinia coronata f. sp. avenae]
NRRREHNASSDISSQGASTLKNEPPSLIRNHPPLVPNPNLKAFAVWGLDAGGSSDGSLSDSRPIPAKRLVVLERSFGILRREREQNATSDKVKARREQELATIMFSPRMSLTLASRPSRRMNTPDASDSSGGSLSESLAKKQQQQQPLRNYQVPAGVGGKEGAQLHYYG